jgi:hypothetical protein
MKFKTQTPVKALLESTGALMSASANAPFKGAIPKNIEAYCAFLQGKGGQGGNKAHHWEVRAALEYIYRDTPIVFDVGAAVGMWSKQFLEYEPEATIYMIEPHKRSQESIRKLHLPNTTLLPYALGAETGTASLHTPPDALVVASLYRLSDSHWKNLEYQQQPERS